MIRLYGNLCHLVSAAHLDRPLELEPHVTLADPGWRTGGLIALTGAGERVLSDAASGRWPVTRQQPGYATGLNTCFPAAHMPKLRAMATPWRRPKRR